MIVVEINKYRPSVFRNGRFLTSAWTSSSQIGETWDGARLGPDEYVAFEDRYVRALGGVLALAGVEALTIRGLEFWEPSVGGSLPSLPVVDAPREGSVISVAQVGDVVRRFLREEAWAELVVERTFLVHPGYDMRMVLATTVPLVEVEAIVRHEGLFSYPGDASLPTLLAWRGNGEATP